MTAHARMRPSRSFPAYAGRNTASIIGSLGLICSSTRTKWHGARITVASRTARNGAGSPAPPSTTRSQKSGAAIGSAARRRRAAHRMAEKHVVSALMERRARLAGELRLKQADVLHLKRALASVD